MSPRQRYHQRMTDAQLRAALARLVRGRQLGMSESDDPLSVLSLPQRATEAAILAFDAEQRRRRGLPASRPLGRADVTRQPAAYLTELLRGKARDRAEELVSSLAPDAHPANQAGALALARDVELYLALLGLIEEHTGRRRAYYSDRDNRAGVH